MAGVTQQDADVVKAPGQVALVLGDGGMLAHEPLADRKRPLVRLQGLGSMARVTQQDADVEEVLG